MSKAFVLTLCIAFILATMSVVGATFVTQSGRYSGYKLLQVKFTKPAQLDHLKSVLKNKEIDGMLLCF